MGDYWERMTGNNTKPVIKTYVAFEKDVDWVMQAMVKIIERKVQNGR